jgi:hypothetical protein
MLADRTEQKEKEKIEIMGIQIRQKANAKLDHASKEM